MSAVDVTKRKADSPEPADADGRRTRPRLFPQTLARPEYELDNDPYNPMRSLPPLGSHELEFRRTHVKHSAPDDLLVRIAIQDAIREDIDDINDFFTNPEASEDDKMQLARLIDQEQKHKAFWDLAAYMDTPGKLVDAMDQFSNAAQHLGGYSSPARIDTTPDHAIRLFLEKPDTIPSLTVAQAKSVFDTPFNLFVWQYFMRNPQDFRFPLAIGKKVEKAERRVRKRYKGGAKTRAEEEWLRFWLHLTEGTKTVEELLLCEEEAERPGRVSPSLESPEHSDAPRTPVREK